MEVEEGADAQTMLNNALEEANKQLKNMPPPSKPKDEVNFDDISSDSSEDEIAEPQDETSSEISEPEENISIDERLVRAESAKMTGNDCYKKQENTEAIGFYNKGLKVLEPLDKEEDMPKDYKKKHLSLFLSLHLNKAAACNRVGNYKITIHSCDKVVKEAYGKDDFKASYIKGLLRRSVAYSATNEVNDAKKDLLEVIRLEPKNKDALRELRKIKELILAEKKRAKTTFGNIFQKNVNIYKDKEVESRKRAAQLKKKRAEKRKKYEKEKQESENPDEFLSFADWEKKLEEEEKEKERKKQEEKERKEKEREEKRRKKKEEERKKKIEKGLDPDADEVELDEEDLAAIADVKKKGYCHFRREKTEDEKELLSNIAPSKITDNSNTLSHVATGDSEHSAWNNAKTWEERDVTEQVKGELKLKLKAITSKNSVKHVEVFIYTDKVSSVSGDAQVVFVSGKKGTVYDMNLELKFKAKVTTIDEKPKSISGKLKFPEIANGIKEHSFEASSSFSKLSTLTEPEMSALRKGFSHFESLIREEIFNIVEKQFSGTA